MNRNVIIISRFSDAPVHGGGARILYAMIIKNNNNITIEAQ